MTSATAEFKTSLSAHCDMAPPETCDALGALLLGMLAKRPMCSRCKIRPALLRLNAGIFCSKCSSFAGATTFGENVTAAGSAPSPSVPAAVTPISREPDADVGDTKQMAGPPDKPSARHVSASGSRDSTPDASYRISSHPVDLTAGAEGNLDAAVTFLSADPGACGFAPEQFGCPICTGLDCKWTHGSHPALSRNTTALRVVAENSITSSFASESET
ncbi:hypothetical protein [uncultured Bradyrhizobium sp.]|uniref:hypothetical protein n=1 Tax=uncultured Bradyrhizobium sp. TaxID=199684 RepID=UPI0035CB6E92